MKKQTQLIIALSLAIVVVAAVIAVLLYTAYQAKQHTTSSHKDTAVITAAGLVKNLQNHAQDEVFKPYTLATQPTPHNTLYVKSDTLNSFVSVPAQVGLTFSTHPPAPLANEQLTKLSDAIAHFSEAYGVPRVDVQTPTSVYAVFSASSVTCNLKGVAGATELQLLCNDATSYTDQLSMVSSLVELWGSDKEHPYITMKTVTSDDKQYALASLTFVATDNAIVAAPLYKKQGTNWSFVADTTASSGPSAGGGKVTTSAPVDSLSKDTHYGPLFGELFNTTPPANSPR